MSSARVRGPPGADQMCNEVLHWHQAVEDELGADHEEGDTEAVVGGEFDKGSHGRGHGRFLRAKSED